MSLTPLQLFKNLSDETRLGIVLLLKEMGGAVRVRSLRGVGSVAAQNLPSPCYAAGKRIVAGSQAG